MIREFMTDDEIARRLRVIEREVRETNLASNAASVCLTRWAAELGRVADVLESDEPTPERR